MRVFGKIYKKQQIRVFVDQYEQEGTNVTTKSKDWKKLEANNKKIALNVQFSPNSKEGLRQANISDTV